jgi:predicted nucleic acid-binding protein
MVDLSSYDLIIGRSFQGTDAWFDPVLERGRGAVFVDTGFFRALLDDRDQYSEEAREHFRKAAGQNFYTTNLVVAEVVRQICKNSSIDFDMKGRRLGDCRTLAIETAQVWICAPPRELVIQAYAYLVDARSFAPSLDLTDALSLVVLNYAQHRRVFGFDGCFRSFGAALEPLA